jgi:CheY-like chemotaxis protein
MDLTPEREAPVLGALRVLVADDSAHMRDYLKTILSVVASHIEEAANGEEAFGILLSETFDLLIADLNMAPIDGAQLVMAVQLLPQERRPKVIVCSADFDSLSPATRHALRQADWLLAKPVAAANLLGAVASVLSQTSQTSQPV